MSEILTTGPMRIPGRITGDPVGAGPDVVRVSIVNPTNKDFRIQLVGEVYDANAGTVTIVPDVEHVIPRNSFLRRTFFFAAQPGDLLRFFAKGDLDEDGKKLELSFVGQRTRDQMNEPTMFFRHGDLIEVENKSIHQGTANINALAANHWGN